MLAPRRDGGKRSTLSSSGSRPRISAVRCKLLFSVVLVAVEAEDDLLSKIS